MKRIAVFLLLICLMFSCGKNNLRNVKKMINRGEIEKVEKLIEEGKIQSEEQVRELIFNKILTDIMLYAKKSEFDKINEILNEREFKQEQYNLICEKVYNAFNSYNSVMELIDSKLPPDSYCFDDTLLMCAVRAQNAECVKKLLAKGADVSKNDQNTKYNALFLSISFNTKDSVEIFKEILNKTKIKDGMCGTIPDRMTQSAGYFEAMLIFNQKEMMDLFLQKEGVKEMVLKQTDTLKILTKYPNYKDIVPSDIVNYDLVVDKNYDYFADAIWCLNYTIISELIKKNVCPVVSGKDYILTFLHERHDREIGMFNLDTKSENYPKLMNLVPVVEQYVNLWLHKNVRIADGNIFVNDKLYASFGESRETVQKRIGEPYIEITDKDGLHSFYEYYGICVDYDQAVKSFKVNFNGDYGNGLTTLPVDEAIIHNVDLKCDDLYSNLMISGSEVSKHETLAKYEVTVKLPGGYVLIVYFDKQNDDKIEYLQYFKE